MLWLRGTEKHIEKLDCTNESGVREIREHRDPGVHSRLHRELSGPMRIMNAQRLTIFQDVKIEEVVFMMKPNEENRRWLSRMRAWTEEFDVCLSLPQSLSVAESEFVELARHEKT